jgi:Ca2+-binding EF-hand superfamily protein
MSEKSQKLTEFEIRELFQKYDVNKDNRIDKEELNLLVRDLYMKNHNIKDIKDLNQNDKAVIANSVEELLKVRNHNKNDSLQIEEFISYNQGNDIVSSTGKYF